jgi:uncharacterized membrane protein YkvA (DUF1232 family)
VSRMEASVAVHLRCWADSRKSERAGLLTSVRDQLKARARQLRLDACALYLASADPRVPWYAKVLVGLVAAYALSPIDLIPDFIPVVGYVDDLLIVPAGIALVTRLIPSGVLDEHRANARLRFGEGRLRSRIGALVVVAVWALLGLWIASMGRRILRK